MSEKSSFWSALNAALGGMAALVTAGTGLYLAFRPDPTHDTPAVSQATPVAASTDTEAGVAYDRTPWLGLEIRQNDKSVRLRSAGGSWDRFEAPLGTGPFEITVTRRADDPSIGILAWHDDSLYQNIVGDHLQLRGSGIAGAEFAIPILYLDKEGFNYYDTGRMKRVADDKFSIFISTIGSGELELPLARFSGPIHLIVFRVPNEIGGTVSPHDFELITLQRR
jgi:hypothetical protein